MRPLVVAVCVLCCLLANLATCAPVTTSVGPEKKLIEWGWDEPSPSFMRANAQSMDALGFDGVIFHPEVVKDQKPQNFSWLCWSARKFEYSELAQSVADLQACNFQHLTDNFLRFNVCPGDVGWFDDAGLSAVLSNAGLAARVAKEGGCKGFMFDVEMYGKPLFSYPQQPDADKRSFAEYEAKVRQRGEEFIRAINGQYPDITVLLTFGYTITGVGGNLQEARYGLLKSFLDGMFAAAHEQTVIVDAYEGAYPFRQRNQFVSAYETVKEGMVQYSGVPEVYRKRVQVGFGVWLDMNWRKFPWNVEDFSKNWFTPQEFAYSLSCALDVSDKYVWIYTETPRWWTNDKVPEAYRQALRDARRPHEIDDSKYPQRDLGGGSISTAPKAAEQEGYSDEATFGDLKGAYDFVADLPRQWEFRTDKDDRGVADEWWQPSLERDGWREMEIGKFWDEQGVRFAGYAWYRLVWETPQVSVPEGGRLVLWFGACDEKATVWVNGSVVGETKLPPDLGWDKRFEMDVTGVLRPGLTNTVVVRVHNLSLAGGLWKSVKLAVKRP